MAKYKFKKEWSTKNATYQKGASFPLTGDITLTAQYLKIIIYMVQEKRKI